MNDYLVLKGVVSSVVYSLIGVIILVVAFWIMEKLTPQNLVKEIIEKQNLAVSVIAAAFIIAIAIIISSAIH
jgi:putative membrane protein